MRLFVYGTLKRGFSNHNILKNSLFIEEDSINGFQMHDMGNFPGITKKRNSVVYGEVYEIDEITLMDCDCLEGYPLFYDRKKVKTRKGNTATVYFLKKCDFPVINYGLWLDKKVYH